MANEFIPYWKVLFEADQALDSVVLCFLLSSPDRARIVTLRALAKTLGGSSAAALLPYLTEAVTELIDRGVITSTELANGKVLLQIVDYYLDPEVHAKRDATRYYTSPVAPALKLKKKSTRKTIRRPDLEEN